MKFLIASLRIFLGLFLFANGLNFWFHWLPIEPPEPEAANRLMDGLVFSGMFALVKYVEIVAGALLLAKRFVPLALAAMLPLTVVIAYVDFVLIQSANAVAFGLLLVIPQALLMLSRLRHYVGIFAMNSDDVVPAWHELATAAADERRAPVTPR